MMGTDENKTIRNLKNCRSITDECIVNNHGRIFRTAGDSIIAEFASPVDLLVAADEFPMNLKHRNESLEPEEYMQFRVGLNLGDVIVEGDNLYADRVNIAQDSRHPQNTGAF